MENGLFSSEAFAKWSKDYTLYLHITTHVEGHKNESLFRDNGFTGFPTLAFLDSEGKLCAKHMARRTVPEVAKTAAKALTYVTMRTKAQAGDPAASQHILIADLALARYSFAAGSLKFATMRSGMTEALRAKAKQGLVDLQYKELRADLSKALRAGLDRAEYSKRYQAINRDFFLAGNLPSGSTAMSVLMNVMNYARTKNQPSMFANALETFKKHLVDNPRYQGLVKRYESQLAKLREDL